jgi:hypothetical protein
MLADNKKRPGLQALLDVEFVPMTVAAAMAYFDITAQRKVVGSAADLVEVGRLVAIALSSVAPLYRMTEDGQRAVVLTSEEINQRLFQAKTSTLEDLAIKRDDLDKAIASLKEARASFDLPLER